MRYKILEVKKTKDDKYPYVITVEYSKLSLSRTFLFFEPTYVKHETIHYVAEHVKEFNREFKFYDKYSGFYVPHADAVEQILNSTLRARKFQELKL